MLSKLPPKIQLAAAGLCLLLVGLCGAISLIWLAAPHADYPHGVVVTGTGRCGTTDWLQRGRSVRVERYRCIVTDDTPAEVFVWYIRNGYRPQNDGLTLKEIGDQVIPVIQIERVYLIEQKDGTTMVRIYDDTTVRAP